MGAALRFGRGGIIDAVRMKEGSRVKIHRRLRWAAIAGPGLIAGGFETIRHSYFDPAHSHTTLGNLGTALIVMAASWLFLAQVFRMMDRAESRLRNERAENTKLRERDRIAGELHDGVSQSVFYLNVKLDDVDAALQEGDAAGVQRELAEMREAVQSVHQRLRQAIYDLKAAEERPPDFVSAVHTYLDEVARQSGVEVEIGDLTHICRDDCPNLELGLLRILQEAVFNAQRHSGARRISVSLRSDEHGDSLVVDDDGIGFDVERVPGEADGHFGLTMMRAEAERLGGRLTVHSRPGTGSTIRFERRIEEGSLHDNVSGAHC